MHKFRRKVNHKSFGVLKNADHASDVGKNAEMMGVRLTERRRPRIVRYGRRQLLLTKCWIPIMDFWRLTSVMVSGSVERQL